MDCAPIRYYGRPKSARQCNQREKYLNGMTLLHQVPLAASLELLLLNCQLRQCMEVLASPA